MSFDTLATSEKYLPNLLPVWLLSLWAAWSCAHEMLCTVGEVPVCQYPQIQGGLWLSLSARSILVPGRCVCCCLWSVWSLFCTLELQWLWYISAELSTADSCTGRAWLMIFASCYSLKAVCTECTIRICRIHSCWRKNGSETWEALIRNVHKRYCGHLSHFFFHSVSHIFIHAFLYQTRIKCCVPGLV